MTRPAWILAVTLALVACGPGVAVPGAVQGAPAVDGGAQNGSPAQNATPAPLPPELAKAESQPAAPGVTGPSYIVMEAGSGRVLLAHRSVERRAPASLTKVMTALMVLERGRLDDIVTVDQSVKSLENTESMLVGLLPGDQISVRDLLYGVLLWSGNDAALVLARHAAGSEEAFVNLMNKRATEMGLVDTRFANTHGLDARNHYSTAYDLARLARLAMQNQTFRDMVATPNRHFTVSGEQYFMYNQNALLQSYTGADGVKIGFTDNAGQTIIGSAIRDGRRLLVVVLGSKNRWADAMALLDLGFGYR